MGKNKIAPLARMIQDIEDVVKVVEHQNLILRRKLENNPFLEVYLHNMIIVNSIACENTMKILVALDQELMRLIAKNRSAHT